MPLALAPPGQDLAAAFGLHSRPKTMGFGALSFLRLVSPLRHAVWASSANFQYKYAPTSCQGFDRGVF